MTTTPALPEPPGPMIVSRFEYNLLRIARFILGQMPPAQAAQLIENKAAAPKCLSRNCVRLLEDTLAKGVVLHLVRAGGWRRDRFLKRNQPVEGRVWERIDLDARRLEFSEQPLRFLIWLTAENPKDSRQSWEADPERMTAADELFFTLAFDAIRPLTEVASALAAQPAFRRNPLCWILHPGEFGTLEEPDPPGFDEWMLEPRSVILECLQPWLTQRGLRRERGKGQIGDWRRMRQTGEAEQAMLVSFLRSVENARRPDLARFVLRTASTIIGTAGDLAPTFWTGGLQGSGPPRLQDRLATQRAALALPLQMETLLRWNRNAQSIGYFDEDYPASQLWKTDWEAAHGEIVAARAQRILDLLEPLRM